MKNSHLFSSLTFSFILFCPIIQPGLANEAEQDTNQSQIAKPSTLAADLLAQDPSPTAIKITGVKLNPSENGLEVVLETATGKISKPVTRTEGNTLIADISNAILALPEGLEFKAESPTATVKTVTVTQLLDGQTVQVSVVGIDAVPVATIKGSQPSATAKQIAENEEEEEEEELVVTATRQEEEVTDIPRSITVIPRQQIEEQSRLTRNLADILGKQVGCDLYLI